LSLSLSSRTGRALLPLTVCFALALRCLPGYCAGIFVGAGASFDVGNAVIDVNCLNVETAGQFVLGAGSVIGVNLVSIESTGELNGATGSLRISGDWWNAGVFNAAQSSINVQDGCGVSESLLLGDNDFFDFSASTANGKTLSIEAGSVQTFASNLSLQGVDPDQRHKIRSSVNGQSAYFELSAQGEQQIYAVDVKDNDASGGQLLVPGTPAEYASVDAGNNTNWFSQLIDIIFRDGFETD
jgi:hypothetical protein